MQQVQVIQQFQKKRKMSNTNKFKIISLFFLFNFILCSCINNNDKLINGRSEDELKTFLQMTKNTEMSNTDVFNKNFKYPTKESFIFNNEMLDKLRNSLNNENITEIEVFQKDSIGITYIVKFDNKKSYILTDGKKVISISPIIQNGKIKGWF
jgi:hypothetical protein